MNIKKGIKLIPWIISIFMPISAFLYGLLFYSLDDAYYWGVSGIFLGIPIIWLSFWIISFLVRCFSNAQDFKNLLLTIGMFVGILAIIMVITIGGGGNEKVATTIGGFVCLMGIAWIWSRGEEEEEEQ